MAEPLKNMYNEQSVAALADAIHQIYPTFNCELFASRVFDVDWDERELKQRMRHITTVLGDFLPANYGTALGIMQKTLPLIAHRMKGIYQFPRESSTTYPESSMN